MTTFWLGAHESNELVNADGLSKLDEEMRNLLDRTNFKGAVPVVDSECPLENHIAKELIESASQCSLKRIGSLKVSFERQDRDTSRQTALLNVDWDEQSSPSCAQQRRTSQIKSGSILLEVVDQSQEG